MCFYWDKNLTSIVLPDSVENIFDYAFSGAGFSTMNISANSNLTTLTSTCFMDSKLSSIFLPKTLITLHSEAFSGCPLENITIDSENTKYKSDSKSIYIGTDNSTLFKVVAAYSGNYTIPKYVTTIYKYCFYKCENLSSIQFHDNISSIGQLAFRGCTSLKNITIPESLSKIENDVFGYCSSLSNILMFENIKIIGSYAFEHCYSLIKIIIPEGVTEIGNGVFNTCYSLVNITIPSSVTLISDNAFVACRDLKTIIFSNNMNTIEIGSYPFGYNVETRNIYIPGNFTIQTSFQNAFQNRSHLYITSDTILSEDCKNFFGAKRVYVHLEGTRIKNKETLDVIKYIAISFEYRKSKQNKIHYSEYFYLVTIFTSMNTKAVS